MSHPAAQDSAHAPNSTSHEKIEYDVIVVGSGAAGMTAAAVAATRGLRVLLLESTAQIGGTTAWSGGMVWIPGNHKMTVTREAELQAARDYLAHTVPPGGDPRLLDTFLARGDEMVRYLEQHTAVRLRAVERYPDYYPARPGATPGGRVLEPEPFNASVLQSDFATLRPPLPEFTVFGGMMVSRADLPHLRRAGRSLRSALHTARLLMRHARERLHAPTGTTLVLGNALAARLYLSVKQLGVDIRLNARVEALAREGRRVTGVIISNGDAHEIARSHAVILATGGLSHDPTLRARVLPEAAGPLSATFGAATARCGARLALDIGAQLSPHTAQQAFWVPASTFTRRDGSRGVFPHTVTDRSKPGIIAVDRHGRRFVNEALSYHEFVKAQLAAGDAATPAWLICDRAFLWRYGLGRIKPFTRRLSAALGDGYLRCASSPRELATLINVPADALLHTLDTYNADAFQGRDPQFGRGGDIYQRHLGDAYVRPNPCVLPIVQAPFYAVAVWPADLGMAAGLVTDEHARVLDTNGTPIGGLYACGNDMQSVMNGSYPGPGITLGPALTFGYLAALDVARSIMGSSER